MAYPYFLVRLLARAGVAGHLPGLPRPAAEAAFLRFYSDRALAGAKDAAPGPPEAFGPDAIDLTLSAPRFDLAPSGSTKLPADRRGPPPPFGMTELRAVIADRHARELPFDPAHDEVLVTAGVSGAWGLTLDAFVNPGDKVVLFDPGSPLYRASLRHRGARARWVPTWGEQGRLRFFIQHLADALRGARVLVLNIPANPTGGCLSADDLEHIAWWADRRDVLVFEDRAYARFAYEPTPPSIATLARTMRRTLQAGSLSMGHAQAAARVGWLVGPRELVEPCARSAAGQRLAVPTVCQELALTALGVDDAEFAPHLEEFDARRRCTFERLQAAGLHPDWPAGGFYCWAAVGHLGVTGREFAAHLARTKKVMVVPGDVFGRTGAGHVRISFAVEDGRLREGLRRIADVVKELENRGKPSKQKHSKAA